MEEKQQKVADSDLFESARIWGLKFEKEVLPEDKHMVVDGFRLHYLDWGTEGKQPMLLLHGGNQTAHTWDFFALTMCPEYHVYALDQRGHGDSEWSPTTDYSAEAHQRDIGGFIDALNLDNFILVGLSMGGNNAYTWAAKNWKRLAGLVIVDIGPETMPQGGRNIQEFVTHAAEGKTFESYVEEAVKFNPRRSPKLLSRSLRHSLRQLPNGNWTWKTDRRRLEGGNPGARNSPEALEKRWDLIRSIKCPTLIVRGAESEVLAESTALKMNQLIPGSKYVVVSKASHTVMGDNPPEFEARVREWLRTIR